MSIVDTPIAFTTDGRPLFDNTPTVVSVLVLDEQKRLIVVGRNNEPGKGLIGLPGGYHMRGESWQQAGVRELWEETGYIVPPDSLHFKSLVTDEYGNNLIIAYADAVPTTDPAHQKPAEVQTVMLLDHALECTEWAFPRHHDAALHLFRHLNVPGPVSVAP
jgi:8-oxo-dGTP pyrophosphatase MutT (NUDIX family)